MTTYGFKSKQIATRLKQIAQAEEVSNASVPQPGPSTVQRNDMRTTFYIKTPEEGIDAYDDATKTAGSADCVLYWLDGVPELTTRKDENGNDKKRTVYNLTDEALEKNRFYHAVSLYGRTVVIDTGEGERLKLILFKLTTQFDQDENNDGAAEVVQILGTETEPAVGTTVIVQDSAGIHLETPVDAIGVAIGYERQITPAPLPEEEQYETVYQVVHMQRKENIYRVRLKSGTAFDVWGGQGPSVEWADASGKSVYPFIIDEKVDAVPTITNPWNLDAINNTYIWIARWNDDGTPPAVTDEWYMIGAEERYAREVIAQVLEEKDGGPNKIYVLMPKRWRNGKVTGLDDGSWEVDLNHIDTDQGADYRFPTTLPLKWTPPAKDDFISLTYNADDNTWRYNDHLAYIAKNIIGDITIDFASGAEEVNFTVTDFWDGYNPGTVVKCYVPESLRTRCSGANAPVTLTGCYAVFRPEYGTAVKKKVYHLITTASSLLGEPQTVKMGYGNTSQECSTDETDPKLCVKQKQAEMLTFSCEDLNDQEKEPEELLCLGQDLFSCLKLCEWICDNCDQYATLTEDCSNEDCCEDCDFPTVDPITALVVTGPDPFTQVGTSERVDPCTFNVTVEPTGGGTSEVWTVVYSTGGTYTVTATSGRIFTVTATEGYHCFGSKSVTGSTGTGSDPADAISFTANGEDCDKSDCSGTCSWVWDATNSYWKQNVNSCVGTNCECSYPTFDGTTNGEETTTNCAPNAMECYVGYSAPGADCAATTTAMKALDPNWIWVGEDTNGVCYYAICSGTEPPVVAGGGVFPAGTVPCDFPEWYDPSLLTEPLPDCCDCELYCWVLEIPDSGALPDCSLATVDVKWTYLGKFDGICYWVKCDKAFEKSDVSQLPTTQYPGMDVTRVDPNDPNAYSVCKIVERKESDFQNPLPGCCPPCEDPDDKCWLFIQSLPTGTPCELPTYPAAPDATWHLLNDVANGATHLCYWAVCWPYRPNKFSSNEDDICDAAGISGPLPGNLGDCCGCAVADCDPVCGQMDANDTIDVTITTDGAAPTIISCAEIAPGVYEPADIIGTFPGLNQLNLTCPGTTNPDKFAVYLNGGLSPGAEDTKEMCCGDTDGPSIVSDTDAKTYAVTLITCIQNP